MSDLCVVCSRRVLNRHHAVSCDDCERWQHRGCDTGISRKDYLKMVRGELELDFLCRNCQQVKTTVISTNQLQDRTEKNEELDTRPPKKRWVERVNRKSITEDDRTLSSNEPEPEVMATINIPPIKAGAKKLYLVIKKNSLTPRRKAADDSLLNKSTVHENVAIQHDVTTPGASISTKNDTCSDVIKCFLTASGRRIDYVDNGHSSDETGCDVMFCDVSEPRKRKFGDVSFDDVLNNTTDQPATKKSKTALSDSMTMCLDTSCLLSEFICDVSESRKRKFGDVSFDDVMNNTPDQPATKRSKTTLSDSMTMCLNTSGLFSEFICDVKESRKTLLRDVMVDDVCTKTPTQSGTKKSRMSECDSLTLCVDTSGLFSEYVCDVSVDDIFTSTLLDSP